MARKFKWNKLKRLPIGAKAVGKTKGVHWFRKGGYSYILQKGKVYKSSRKSG